MYIIRTCPSVNKIRQQILYWSNDYGWVDRASATEFSKEEKKYLNLPINGVWVKVKNT